AEAQSIGRYRDRSDGDAAGDSHRGLSTRAASDAGRADGVRRCGDLHPDAAGGFHRDGGRGDLGEGAGTVADVSADESGGGVMTFKETMDLIALFILPVLIVGLPIYGLIRRVPVYEKFVEGAKDGFTTSVRIIPY